VAAGASKPAASPLAGPTAAVAAALAAVAVAVVGARVAAAGRKAVAVVPAARVRAEAVGLTATLVGSRP